MPPTSEAILLLLCSIIGPVSTECAAALFTMAPELEIPSPFTNSDSAADKLNPFKSSTAPLAIVVRPTVVPRGELAPLPLVSNFKVPAVMTTGPVNVLALLILSVPPAPFWMMPLVPAMMTLTVSSPEVCVALRPVPVKVKVPVPLSENPPPVKLMPKRLVVATPVTLNRVVPAVLKIKESPAVGTAAGDQFEVVPQAVEVVPTQVLTTA